MKYRHYAPKGELTIVEGDPKKVAAYINEQTAAHKSRGEKTGIIQPVKWQRNIRRTALRLPAAGMMREAIARQLYTFLREFDDEDVAFMYSEAFDLDRNGTGNHEQTAQGSRTQGSQCRNPAPTYIGRMRRKEYDSIRL